MADVIVVAIVVVAIVTAIGYIHKEKKKGNKCIGCPYSRECGGKCTKK